MVKSIIAAFSIDSYPVTGQVLLSDEFIGDDSLLFSNREDPGTVVNAFVEMKRIKHFHLAAYNLTKFEVSFYYFLLIHTQIVNFNLIVRNVVVAAGVHVCNRVDTGVQDVQIVAIRPQH